MRNPLIDLNDPKSWSGPVWMTILIFIQALPDFMNETTQKDVSLFLKSMSSLLPCEKCRDDWHQAMIQDPPDEPISQGREALKRWICHRKSMIENRLFTTSQMDSLFVKQQTQKQSIGMSTTTMMPSFHETTRNQALFFGAANAEKVMDLHSPIQRPFLVPRGIVHRQQPMIKQPPHQCPCKNKKTVH